MYNQQEAISLFFNLVVNVQIRKIQNKREGSLHTIRKLPSRFLEP